MQQLEIPPARRFTREHPCPICGGHEALPQGKGVRCWGFLSADGEYAHCSRAERAGGIPQSAGSNTHAHRLVGPCNCGVTHIAPPAAPQPIERVQISERSFVYTNADGDPIAVHMRYDYDDGSKSMPWRLPTGESGRGVIKPDELPLYGLLGVLHTPNNEPVYFTEGETACDAILALGLTAAACGGGSSQQTFPAFAALAGRLVFLLPDNDEPGAAYMRRATDALTAAGATPIILPLPGLTGKGDDVVEWLAAGNTRDDLERITVETWERHEAGIASIDRNRYPGLNLLALPDFLALELPKLQWIADRVLLQGGTSLLVAKAKVGKTTLAREIIRCALTGQEWHVGENEVRRVRKVPVIYSAKEEHAAVLQRQLRDAGLHIAPLYIDQPSTADGETDMETTLDSLERAIRDLGARLVVIDPMADFLSIADLNNYVEMRKALMRLTRIARRTDCHIMLLHHSNKGGQGSDAILGSAALSGAVDTMLLMRRVEQVTKENRHERLNERYLWSIQRYGEDIPKVRVS